MTEVGFYHTSRGYWQTTEPPSTDVLAGYPAGTVEVPIKPGDGFIWDGASWVTDPGYAAALLVAERAGMTASSMQVRLALLAIGRLAEVEAIVAASTQDVQIAWEKAAEFRRNSPMIAGLAPSAVPPFSAADLDDLFRAAAQIEV